jgi:hypothetical protein
MPKISMHITEIAGNEYAFKATDGLYNGAISTATGITLASLDEQDLPEYAVKELLQKGILRRVRAITLANGKRGSLDLLVAKDMLSTALDALKGESYSITGGSSGIIKSVGFPTKVVSRG